MSAFALPLAISGLSALGGIFANKAKKQTQTSRSNTAGDFSQDTYSTPTYDPYTEEMRQKLIQQYLASLEQDPDLSGYKAAGLSNINQASDVRNMALRNSLASRGLSYSPIAPLAQQTSDNARIGESNTFLNTIPLLQRKLQDERLGAAGGFFKGLPVGQHNAVTGTQHSGTQSFTEGTIPGNPIGGGLSSFATTLAGLYGEGAFNGVLGQKSGQITPKRPNLQGWQ